MAKWCLNKQFVDKFKKAIKDREIDPIKLSQMTSIERRTLLEKYVGKENAQQVNSLFESKLLFKNLDRGYISWAEKVSGVPSETKKELLKKIQIRQEERTRRIFDPKDEELFLEDLASTRIGFGIKADEAKQIFDLSKKVQEAQKFQEKDLSFKIKEQARDYAKARTALENYVDEAKGNNKFDFKSLLDIGGLSKSNRASMDNSAIFRQGWKTLTNHPITWARNALKTFSDIAKQVGNKNVMDELKIEQYSRPNDLNGNYKKMALAITKPEETIAPTVLEKVPVLGRLYKASEVAYTGFVYRLRMDLADKYLEIAQKSGVELTDKELASIGSMVNSLTGRGNFGKYEGSAVNLVNNVFFSPRNMKSQVDTLGHVITGAGEPFKLSLSKKDNFVRRQAAFNLVKTVSAIAGIMTLANAVAPGSAETDPRSANFGKIKVGDTRFDITGGLSSLVTLAARLVSQSSKSSITGQVKPINSGDFGATTGKDVVTDFITNKLSPVGQVALDLINQKDRNGNDLSISTELSNLFLPLSVATFQELANDPHSANILASMIADGLGIATNTYGVTKKDWAQNTGAELTQFKEKVGDEKFKQANDTFNTAYQDWVVRISQNSNYKKLSDEDKSNINTKAQDKIKSEIFKTYNFKHKQAKKTYSEKQAEKALLK